MAGQYAAKVLMMHGYALTGRGRIIENVNNMILKINYCTYTINVAFIMDDIELVLHVFQLIDVLIDQNIHPVSQGCNS
jgi:hypothetical protein